jgi:UTP--glucose-1-phosphate uridylyltransferase
MLPVGRKPVVQYVVEELHAAGIEQILFITGRKKSVIEDHFDADAELSRLLDRTGLARGTDRALADGVPGVFYTRQGKPTGVADAVRLGRNFAAGESIVVAFGDTILKGGDLVGRLIQAHQTSQASCTLAVEEIPREDVFRYGIVDVQQRGDLLYATGLVEKPDPASAPSNLAIVPRYVFSPSIFETIDATPRGKDGERWLTDAIAILARETAPVRVVPLDQVERRYDIGNFESYYRAFVDFALSDPEYGDAVRRHIRCLDDPG